MDTKQSSSPTPNSLASTVEKSSIPEYTLPTSSLNDLMGYVSWLKARVDLLQLTDQRCSKCSSATPRKISGLFSREITQLEKALRQEMGIGL